MSKKQIDAVKAERIYANVDYNQILWAMYFTPWGQHPVYDEIDWGARGLLHGAPGAVKTASVRRLANELGNPFYSLKPGARGQGGFGVTPVPKLIATGPDGQLEQFLTFPGPDWIAKLGERPSIVLCDEMNTAPPTIQSALLGFIQEKEMGSVFMHGRSRVFGATNSVEDAAGGWDLAPSVANRLGHIQWPDPPQEDWSNYILGGCQPIKTSKFDVTREEARVLSAWPASWAKAAGLITSYLKRRPEHFRVQPPAGSPQASLAWPSPRTWEYACRMLTSAYIHNLNESETDLLIDAYIGNAVGGELATWIRDQDLMDPVDLVEGKAKFMHNPHRLDRTAATISSLVALVTPENAESRQPRAKKVWGIITELMNDVEDVVVPAAISMYNANLYNMVEAEPVVDKILPILKAAHSRRRK